MSTQDPLFAFANVHYRLPKPEPVAFARPTDSFALSARLHTATPQQLKTASVKSTDQASMQIDDFQSDWQDWYRLSADNPHHWQYWTRKINDPKWRGRNGYQLQLQLQSEQPNQLVIVITTNFFRSYRGKSQDYVTVVDLAGGIQTQTVTLAPSDFKSADSEEKLSDWDEVDLLGMRGYYEVKGNGELVGSKEWRGPQPKFHDLRWTQKGEN